MAVVDQETFNQTYMTVHEVAVIFRTGRSTVSRWCRKGDIDSIRTPGGGYLIPREAVEAFLRKSLRA